MGFCSSRATLLLYFHVRLQVPEETVVFLPGLNFLLCKASYIGIVLNSAKSLMPSCNLLYRLIK